MQDRTPSPLDWAHGTQHGVVIVVSVVLAVSLLAAALRWRRSVRRAGGKPVGAKSALYRRLVACVRGDTACADRLVQHEREQAPGASGAELIRRALQRLERDRGR